MDDYISPSSQLSSTPHKLLPNLSYNVQTANQRALNILCWMRNVSDGEVTGFALIEFLPELVPFPRHHPGCPAAHVLALPPRHPGNDRSPAIGPNSLLYVLLPFPISRGKNHGTKGCQGKFHYAIHPCLKPLASMRMEGTGANLGRDIVLAEVLL